MAERKPIVLIDGKLQQIPSGDTISSTIAPGNGGNTPYDIRFGFKTTPASSEVIDTLLVPREISLPADLIGSLGAVGTNPTASFVLSLKDDGTEIATITVSTGGVFTFATTGGTTVTITVGSVLTLEAPATADTTVANFTMTLMGTI